MDKFPSLDIEEDLENLISDEEPIAESEQLSEEAATITPPERIFVEKPTNKVTISELPEGFAGSKIKKSQKPRKALSEKQLAHLDRIRTLASQKKKEKKEAKDKLLHEFNSTYKSKTKTKTKQVLTKTKDNVPKENVPDVPDVPDVIEQDIEDIIDKQPPRTTRSAPIDIPVHKPLPHANEEDQFLKFMSNMEKYETVKQNYDRIQKQKQVSKKTVPLPHEQAQVRNTALKKTIPNTPSQILKPVVANPYQDIFQW